ncbi:MAG: Ig-like domain-containing protein, partial [Bacteroidota bacterium]
MNPKRLLHLFLIIIISIANAQIPDNIQRYRNEPKGEIKNRKKGLLDGNRVRTQFFNTGEVSDWYNGAVSAPHLEWPKGTGHRHLDGYTFLVGSKFKIIDANNIERYITPIETQYREEMDRDPATGLIWGFEPLPGYVNPSSSTPAMSNNKESFPSVWPEALGLSPSWNGKWYSPYEGHTNDGMVETFYVMDDSRDKEFTKYPYNYFPVASDSDRGGLGLRVEVRATEFFWQPLQDVIFWDHTVANISDHDYDTTAFGLFIDPSVGSVMNDVDVNYPLSLTYFWAPSGKGLPDNFATGYLGIGVLASPNGNDSSNIASVRVNPLADKTQASVWPKNDLPMWLAMTGEFGDTTIINGNTSTVIGSNIFSFPKWSIAKYVVAMILGTDLPEIIMKKSIAKGAYDHSFILSDSIENTGTLKISVTSPIANSTLSGTVNVAWNVAGAAGKTISYIYCSKDNTEWSLIGIESAGTGTFNWNTTLFPDGIFNTLRVLT